LGKKYEIEIESITKPRPEYQTTEYRESGLPAAPAVMVANELVAQGADITEEKLEAVIRRHLGVPLAQPPE